MSHDVSVHINDQIRYCERVPFDPPAQYMELSSLFTELDPSNLVYAHIRTCLINLGLDDIHYGTSEWNPFSGFIKEGDTVLIKPNLVLHYNGKSDNIHAVVTHGSVVRPLIDYVLLALKGTGRVIIGDAPHGNADFEKIVDKNGLRALVDWYRSKEIFISLLDFRKVKYKSGPNGFADGVYRECDGDPAGYIEVNLGNKSFLNQMKGMNRLYGSDYDRKFIVKNHIAGHKYLLAGSVMKANVVISVPKLKTHKKTGVTINCKNLVGINGDKNYLAHYRIGDENDDGDEHPIPPDLIAAVIYKWDRFARDHFLASNKTIGRKIFKIINKPFALLQKIYERIGNQNMIVHGDWYGNDTTWRMCLDLNYILLYANRKGELCEAPQRRYFCLIDGILAGEGNGPMEPMPKSVGYIACGMNQFMVDYVCIYQMGFDPDKLSVCCKAQEHEKLNFDTNKFKVICKYQDEFVDFATINMKFLPQSAWKGKIER